MECAWRRLNKPRLAPSALRTWGTRIWTLHSVDLPCLYSPLKLEIFSLQDFSHCGLVFRFTGLARRFFFHDALRFWLAYALARIGFDRLDR